MTEFEFTGVLLRYNEIALKGANRKIFEKELRRNIFRVMKETQIAINYVSVHGRMWFTKADQSPFTADEWEKTHTALCHVCGLASFSPVLFVGPTWDEILPFMIKLTTWRLQRALDESRGIVTFRLRVRRSDKRFPFESRECETKIVEALPTLQDEQRLKLDLKHAEITIGLEIRTERAMVWFDTVQGIGGLPSGSNDPVLTLLSGGIDSPVAAWRIFKRGCKSDFITFHSFPYTPTDSVEKVKRMVHALRPYQGYCRLFICNIAEFQKAVRDGCESRFRTVLYRRAMMRIATKIALDNKLGALVTGEAVGQVASQTVANLNTIDDAAGLIVLRPLCGMDKQETITLAEQIGTYEISKEAVPDSCTVFAPAEPATRAKIGLIRFEESRIENYDRYIEEAVRDAEVYTVF